MTMTTKTKTTSSGNFASLPLWKKLNWVHFFLLTSTPLIAIYGFFTTELLRSTLIWSIIYYYITGLGITAGYHRLWSHKSYSATPAYEWFMVLAGGGAVEGSVIWWSRDHRVHHRFTDTDKDPYDANKGFLWSHMGWMVMRKDSSKIGRASVSDLEKNYICKWQTDNYAFVALFMGFIFPTLVAGLGWGDWRGGYFYAAVARLVFVHHATFCVNSLAHWLGEHSFDDKHTPRDHFFTAFVTMGEGYHNFHHEFPQDYRNAIRFYQYDPTKWLVYACSLVGLTYDLKMFPKNEVKKGQVQMMEKKINKLKEDIDWGKQVETLPMYTMSQFLAEVQNNGRQWVVIDHIIIDCDKFINEHPGGRSFINNSIGRDATAQFNGGIYDHSNAARNLMTTLRVGVIKPDSAQTA